MSEPTPLYDAARVHTADQNEAAMVSLGRSYAALWRALLEGGMPPAVAADFVGRQHGATLAAWVNGQVQ